MNSRLIEHIATQHTAELLTARTRGPRRTERPAGAVRAAAAQSRRRTGWALISVGLWLASEGR
jgi:hypothetical protein